MAIDQTRGRQTLGLSVVVPCHNEGENISPLHERLSRACMTSVGDDYELIFVNDGSRDDTWVRIAAYAARDAHVVGVDLSRNYGHQLAVSAGLSITHGDRVLIIDADLQDPPELLPKMLEAMQTDVDVVYGVRTDRQGESWFKKTSAKAFYRILRMLSDTAIPVDSGDFRLLSRRVVDLINSMPEQGRFLRGLVAWTGFRQIPIPYARSPRSSGTSSYPVHRMILFSLDAITAFSTRPLRVAVVLGLGFGGFGLLVLTYAMESWLTGAAIAGWTSVMVAVLILGSAQLLVLGIIGEYVGRLVIESKRRPLFIIRETLRGLSNVRAA